MKFLATLCVVAFGVAALAADPTLEIKPTGTTNNNNKVVISFEVKNLPIGKGVKDVAELKINGNLVAATTYVLTIQGGTKGTITINGALPPGKATVDSLKVNLSGGLDPVSQMNKEVDLKMGTDDPVQGTGSDSGW